MIHSMTGFARAQSAGDWGSATFEMRTTNHRYVEMSIHLPDMLHGLEMPIRDRIKHDVKRGKVECHIRYQASESAGSLMEINTSLTKQLVKASETVAAILRNPAPMQAMEILRWPGVLQITEIDFEKLETEILNLLEKVLSDLVAARAREGNDLKELFLQRLDAMKLELAKVRKHIPEILADQRQRLIKRFTDAQIELNPDRLEQEIVMYAQKIDVMEEIERTETHINEIRRVLKQGGLMGRRLDFLMQELNREANTLGSKSVDPATTHAAVELKVLIEQMREQVQNIE